VRAELRSFFFKWRQQKKVFGCLWLENARRLGKMMCGKKAKKKNVFWVNGLFCCE